MTVPKPLDPRAPWVASVHDLARRPGELRLLQRSVEAPAGVGVELIRAPEGRPMHLDLRLESVTEGVLVTGTVETDLVGECARCLGPVREHQRFDLQELYYYPGRDADEDALFVCGDLIDLEPPMRDAIVPELPFTPLCREDCLGLCPECGFCLNDDPGHTHDKPVDPRWTVLRGLADRG